MSLDDFPLLKTSVDLNEAIEAWAEVTGYQPGAPDSDTVLENCLVLLRDADLMDERRAERLVLALLVGAILYEEGDLSVLSEKGQALRLYDTTRRAINVVTNLGTPTGYEDDPDRLARYINEGRTIEEM